MQRVRIGKGIALIGLVTACLLLCSAHFQPATKLYRQSGGRAAVGGAGEFSFHPHRWRTDRKLEGRADLVG